MTMVLFLLMFETSPLLMVAMLLTIGLLILLIAFMISDCIEEYKRKRGERQWLAMVDPKPVVPKAIVVPWLTPQNLYYNSDKNER